MSIGRNIGLSNKEKELYSIQRAIMAMITDDWSKAGFEREVSDATRKIYAPKEPRGISIAPDISWGRAFDVGTPANAGSLVQSDIPNDQLGDALRPALSFGQLGATFLRTTENRNVTISALASTTGTDVALETALVSPTQPTTRQIQLTAHRAFAQIPVSKQALIQNPGIGEIVQRDAIKSMAAMMEKYGINGTGAVPQPLGILNGAGIGAVVGGTNGAQIAWSHIVDLEGACALSNAEPTALGGYIVNSKSRQWMKKNLKTSSMPIWGGGSPDFPLNDKRAAVTTNIPSNLTKGTSVGVASAIIYGADWSQLIVALMGAVEIDVDPATFAASGLVKINVSQYFDIGIRQPGGFAVMLDALTA